MVGKYTKPKSLPVRHFLFCFILAITMCILFTSQSHKVLALPDTCTWTGDIDSNWSNGGNWTGCDNGSVPENGDTLVFPTSATNTILNNDIVGLTLSSIYFNGNNYTLSGNDIVIDGSSGFLMFVGNNNTINVDVSFNASIGIVALWNDDNGENNVINGTINLNVTNADFIIVNENSLTQFYIPVINGTVNGGNVYMVGNPTGFGEIVSHLGASSFTADSVIVGTRFICRNNNCLGNPSNIISIETGGVTPGAGGSLLLYNNVHATYSTFYLNNQNDTWVVSTLDFSNSTITGQIILQYNSSLTAGANSTLNINGDIDLNAYTLSIGNDVSQTTWFNGTSITGTGNIEANKGIFYLSTSGMNTFTGIVNILENARLDIQHNNSLGNSTTINVNNGGCLTISAPISTSSSHTVNIAGNGSSLVSGCGAALQINSNSTINFNTLVSQNSSILLATNVNTTINGSLTVNNNSNLNVSFLANAALTFDTSSSINVNTGGSIHFMGAGSYLLSSVNINAASVPSGINGTGNLFFSNIGVTIIGTTHSFDGNIFVTGNSVLTVTNSSLGTTVGTTTIGAGSVLRTNNSFPIIFAETIYIQGNGNISGIYNTGAFINEGNTVTFNGQIVLQGNTTFVNNGNVVEFVGPITGLFDLTLTRTSPLGQEFVFSGSTSNTHKVTYVNGTELVLRKLTGIAVPNNINVVANASFNARLTLSNITSNTNQISDNAVVGIYNSGSNSASFHSQVLNEIIGSVIGNGVILFTFVGDGITLGGNNTSGTFHGSINNSGTIIKIGNGSWTLNGVSGSGSTLNYVVNSGTFVFNSNLPNAVVNINGNSVLQGNGSINSLTANDNSKFRPGNSPGCMTLSSLTMTPSSTFEVEINGLTPCTQYDQITVNGPINLGNATLQVILGFTPNIGDTFVIIDGISPVLNTFAGLPNNSTFSAGGYRFSISYNRPGNEGDVILTVVDDNPLPPTGERINLLIPFVLIVLGIYILKTNTNTRQQNVK
ncbi:MAG: hypothetical protein NZZ41_04920 [Candidatus Dojkabacteria bacterium]|nr:hypothetical protein [Candidatus Dojkabacteria bacterium]